MPADRVQCHCVTDGCGLVEGGATVSSRQRRQHYNADCRLRETLGPDEIEAREALDEAIAAFDASSARVGRPSGAPIAAAIPAGAPTERQGGGEQPGEALDDGGDVDWPEPGPSAIKRPRLDQQEGTWPLI